jgi:hypothetical protein
METGIITQNQKVENPIELSIIQNIHEIRGVRVMLDFDLAAQYGIETKVLKQAVRRNIRRFEGADFMFEITRGEYNSLRSQFVTLEVGGRGKYSKYQSFAFTELGVAMLSSVLHSDTAIDINRKIMRAFVAIRNYVLTYTELKHELYDLNVRLDKTDIRLDDNDAKTDEVFKMLTELLEQKKAFENRPRIGFNAHKDNN